MKLSELLNGEWTVTPPPEWHFDTVATSKSDLDLEKSNLFFALGKEMNEESTNNQDVYEEIAEESAAGLSGFVVEKKLENLSRDIPQLLVEDTYDALKKLAAAMRENYKGQVVAIKGPAISESTKNMLNYILSHQGNVIVSKGNKPTITDVPLTIISSVENPDYIILEVDISALDTNPKEISQVTKPTITIINSLGDIEDKSPSEIEAMKKKICDGITPGGFILLNKDIAFFEEVKMKLINSGSKVLTYGLSDDTDIYLMESTRKKEDSISARVNIWEEEVEYDVSALNKEELLNSLAVIGVVWLLDLDVEKATQLLKAYRGTDFVK